jgi:hypothetical protein
MATPIRSRTFLALLAVGAMGIIGAIGAQPADAANAFNACGCREGAPGQCVCEKKSRCGCPGECEPKGCEEKRAKQLEKEIQVETKKAEEAQRRQRVRQEKSTDDSNESSPAARKDNRDRNGDNGADESSGGAQNNQKKPPKEPRIVKMTPAQKRDLGKLLGAYLAEHPGEGNTTVDQVQAQLRK